MESSSSCQPSLEACASAPMDGNDGNRGRHPTERLGPVEQPRSSNVKNYGQSSPSQPTCSQAPFVLSETQERADRSYTLLKKFKGALFSTNDADSRDEESLASTRKHVFVSFGSLQRMRLWKLKRELVNRVMSMHFREEEPSDWENLLKEYFAAVRDDVFIRKHFDDQPHLGYSTLMLNSRLADDAEILELELSRIPQECREAKGEWTSISIAKPKHTLWADDVKWRDIHIKRHHEHKARIRQTFQRMGVAVLGGVFLVGPMWLMVLQNELYTTLISTTGFVFGFGLVLSLVPTFVDGAKIGLDTVMSATAAYAAVLVVFVGTTTPTSTGSS